MAKEINKKLVELRKDGSIGEISKNILKRISVFRFNKKCERKQENMPEKSSRFLYKFTGGF